MPTASRGQVRQLLTETPKKPPTDSDLILAVIAPARDTRLSALSALYGYFPSSLDPDIG